MEKITENTQKKFANKLRFLKKFPWEKIIPICIVVIGLFWFCVTALQYREFAYKTGDTSVAEQAIWNTAHGRFLHQSFLGTETNLREHISLIQLAYVPIYAALPHTLTLFFLIQLSFVAGALYLFYYVKNKLSVITATLAVGIFIFNPLTASQVVGDMHVVSVAGPAFLMLLIAYHEKQYRKFLFWTAFMVLIAEFVAPTLALVGVLAFLERRNWKWFLPPVVGGMGLYMAAKYYITIGFGSDENIIAKFKPEVLKSIYKLEKRLDLIKESLASLLWIFPFFSKYSILLVPSLLVALLIIAPGRIGGGNHVFILIPAILSIIFIDLQERFPKYRKLLYLIAIIGILISMNSWLKWMKIDSSEQAVEMKNAVVAVKDDGSVTASTQFGPNLCRRKEFFFPSNDKMTDYVVIKKGKTEKNSDASENQEIKYDQKIADSGLYRVVFKEGRVIVFAKKEKISKILNISSEELAGISDDELQKSWAGAK